MATDFSKAVRFMHMSVTREYLLRMIDQSSQAWKDIVSGAKTRAEAREFIANGPASHAIGECPDYTDELGCPGHERKS